MSIPLPLSDEGSSSSSDSDEQESPNAEAKANSPPAQRSYHQQAEMMDSPTGQGVVTSTSDAGLPSGEVTNNLDIKNSPDQPHERPMIWEDKSESRLS